MDLQHQFCPSDDCPARGHKGRGNIRIHSRKEQRCRCTVCGHTFSARTGTPFYRLHTPPEMVSNMVSLLSLGCPRQAIVQTFGFDERTVALWQERAARQCQAVHEHLVLQPRPVQQMQMDEICGKRQGGDAWMAMAMDVRTRLWLGGAVAAEVTCEMLGQLARQMCACVSALGGAFVICCDGLRAYKSVLRQAFTVEGIRHFVLEPDGLSQPWRRVVQVRDQVPQSGPRPRCLWHGLHIVQAAKVYLANAQGERSRVIGVEQRVVEGDAAQARELILASQNGHGSGHANTSYMERLNGTFRERLATLVRRCRHLARYLSTLEQGMYLVGTHYNFCCEHEGLRRPGIMGGHKWLDQTPAMAAGITDHCWSVSELLWYRVPPERWRPQRKRGPVPRALKDLIARWCP